MIRRTDIVPWLLNFQVIYLRDECAEPCLCADTLRQKLQIKLAILPSYSRLTQGLALLRPVPYH